MRNLFFATFLFCFNAYAQDSVNSEYQAKDISLNRYNQIIRENVPEETFKFAIIGLLASKVHLGYEIPKDWCVFEFYKRLAKFLAGNKLSDVDAEDTYEFNNLLDEARQLKINQPEEYMRLTINGYELANKYRNSWKLEQE